MRRALLARLNYVCIESCRGYKALGAVGKDANTNALKACPLQRRIDEKAVAQMQHSWTTSRFGFELDPHDAELEKVV